VTRSVGPSVRRSVAVVLASSSPRRRELLGLLGITPEVVPANIEEVHRPAETPTEYVLRLAREKCAAVRRDDALVIAADTTVALRGQLLEKPRDTEDAVRMLTLLGGTHHVVHTAMAVRYAGREASGVETTTVWFRAVDEAMARAYVATGEPMDKAGAYGIQGYGAVLVEKLDGDYFTVMGLGLTRLVTLFEDVGLSYDFRAGIVPKPA
jgi:septum formation protein